MKLLTIIAVLTLTGCASTPFENWSKADTARQIAYSTLHVADWIQTRKIADCDDESNPILGLSPDRSTVDIYMGGTLVLQTVAAGLLKPEYRKWYQNFWIVAEGYTVVRNYQLGYRVEF
jgi:hypothetical protein